ncbi:MAG: hypothetical protein JO256_15690 [Alphaproteobacteria bacterium]|nr:hypothetical protein [Alphaproteobacteria bacterium]
MRSFVVTVYEPAFRDDGCPAAPDNDYGRMLSTPWRSAADIAELTKPAPQSIEPYRLLAPALHSRGFTPGIDTYLNPFAAPDPGLPEVRASVAEGFDLDGNAATGGFASPDGVRGIDNALYRALGCLAAFRGAGEGSLSARANARMLEGLQTILIRLSGKTSPTRDDDVTVEIGSSPDKLVRNKAGDVLRDYSYRLTASTTLHGRIRNGILTTTPFSDLKTPDFAWSESNRGAVIFQRGRLRLTLAADGSASGLIGGYRDWRELYARLAFNVAVEGPFLEIPYHLNLIGIYYALQRNADADPDARNRNRNRAISIAYRLSALPAFAVDRAGPLSQPPPSARILAERAAFLRATASRRITPSP